MKKQHKYIDKAIILMLLCIYTFGLIKPTMPLIKDLLAHAFFEKSHKATVHYENGKYHIHLEIQNEIKKSDTKQVPVFLSKETVYMHTKTDCISFVAYLQAISEINSPYFSVPIDLVTSSPFLPPEC